MKDEDNVNYKRQLGKVEIFFFNFQFVKPRLR